MNKGDDTFYDSEQSSISEVEDEAEPWAVRFAEMLRIEVAQNLLTFSNIEDINGQIKEIGDKVKL